MTSLKGTDQSVARREHDLAKEAKRMVLVDPFGGVVTQGNFEERIDGVYFGSAQIGTNTNTPGWQIYKKTVNGISFADNTDEFSKVWDNRLLYTYSITGDSDKEATETKQDEILTELQNKTEPEDIQIGELIIVFRALLQSLQYPAWIDRSANVIRNQVQSGTVTTVTTVTNLTNFGSMPADSTFRLQTINTWAVNNRSLIT